jgi:WD40 repeat protein
LTASRPRISPVIVHPTVTASRRSSRPGILFALALLSSMACGPAASPTKAPPPLAQTAAPSASVAEEPPAPPIPSAAVPISDGPPPRQVLDTRQNDTIDAVTFTPDGRRLATVSEARVVTVWDLADRALLRTFRVPELLPPLSLAWGADEHQLVVGQGASLLLDAESGARVGPFLDSFGGPSGQRLRWLPSRKDTPWFGFYLNDAALFGEDRKVATKLPWPSGTAPAAAWVKAVAVSKDGKLVAAAAASKGLYLWDLGSSPPSVRNLPIDGDAVDVTLSPRGALLAVKPKTGDSRIDEVDVAAGRVTRTVTTLADNGGVRAIAASPDGARVVAISLGKVTAFDVSSGAVAWQQDSDLMIVEARHDFGSILHSVAWSPIEALVAVGNERGDVVLIDGRTGRLQGELGVGVRRPNALVFSASGKSLLATSDYFASRWSLEHAHLDGAHLAPGVMGATRLAGEDFLVGRAPFRFGPRLPTEPLPPCGSDGTIAAYATPWSQSDALAALPGITSRQLVLEDAPPAVAASAKAPPPADARPICVPRALRLLAMDGPSNEGLFSIQPPEKKPVSDMNLAVADLVTHRSTTLAKSEGFGVVGGLSAGGKWAYASNLKSVVVWDAKTGAQQAEIKLPLIAELAVAFSPDASRVALAYNELGHGTVAVHEARSGKPVWSGAINGGLFSVAFTADGKDVFVGSLTGEIGLVHEGKVSSVLDGTSGGLASLVAPSPDGKTLASVHQDGAIRIWDLASRALRASLVDFDDDEWAVTTPGGAFTGTAEVGPRIGWVFEAPLDRFSFEQFAARFRVDSVVAQRLWTGQGDVSDAVGRPPALAIVGQPAHEGGRAKVRLRALSPSKVAVVRAFLDGRPVGEEPVGQPQGEVVFDVRTHGGGGRLTFLAQDDRGLLSHPVALDVKDEGRPRPDLWLVSVGVGQYPQLSPEEQLVAPSADARSVADVFAEQSGAGRPFANVHSLLLPEEQATAAGVLDALSGLSAMKPDDLAVVFLAGHGAKVGEGDMRFLTRDVKRTRASLMHDGVGWGDISTRLAAARGHVLVLLDACHSGHMSQELVVPNGALASRLSAQGRAGVLVFAAAKGRQESLEDGQHGFFTRALLETLHDPRADRDHDGLVEVSELLDAVTVRVNGFTHGRQTPWVARREAFGDFVVGRVAPAASP